METCWRGASASVSGHPQPFSLSLALPPMAEGEVTQLLPPLLGQHAKDSPPSTAPTLESMGTPVRVLLVMQLLVQLPAWRDFQKSMLSNSSL